MLKLDPDSPKFAAALEKAQPFLARTMTAIIARRDPDAIFSALRQSLSDNMLNKDDTYDALAAAIVSVAFAVLHNAGETVDCLEKLRRRN